MSSASSVVDPVSVWNKSESSSEYRSVVPIFWRSLAAIPEDNQMETVTSMLWCWPYKHERRPLVHGSDFTAFVTSASTGCIASSMAKICGIGGIARMVLVGLPIASMYTLALLFHSQFVRTPLLTHPFVCSPCILTRQTLMLLGFGVIIPAVWTPVQAVYILQTTREFRRLAPNAKTAMQLTKVYRDYGLQMMRNRKFIRYPIAMCVASLALSYWELWARDRVVSTIENEPGLFWKILAHANIMKGASDDPSALKKLFKQVEHIFKPPIYDVLSHGEQDD